MDLLLDINVAVDSCTGRKPWCDHVDLALIKCRSEGGRLWLYSGSVQTLEYVTRQELLRNLPDDVPSPSARQLEKQARNLLEKFTADKQWLAALAGEGPVFDSPDPEDEQLIRALGRFTPGSIKLLTRDEALGARYPELTITPLQYLQTPMSAKPIAFIDLKTQQDQLRPQLERSIHTVLHHGQYIMGPEVKALEAELAKFVGVEHCISCASGTDALLMALMVLDTGPGDEVITVPYTWISTAEVIALLRAKPVFVDIQPDTFNMDPDHLEAAITPNTKAIMPVGIYGQTADMQRINAIAAAHNLPVIEDAAQSFGANHHGKKSCNLSRIGCTSFFPSKPLGCYGDGGAIFTPDAELAEKLRQIRIHGQKVKHQHPLVGINGRLDTVQAAILLAKLERFAWEVQRRHEIGIRYTELINSALSTQHSVLAPVIAEGNSSVYAQYTILAENRDALAESLRQQNIPAVAYYTAPLHLQGAFANLNYQPGDFPVAEQVAEQCLSLPMSSYLSEAEQQKVALALAQYRGL